MLKFCFTANKKFINGKEMHFEITNLEDFVDFYNKVSKEVSDKIYNEYKITKDNNIYRYKEPILVNNLKILQY